MNNESNEQIVNLCRTLQPADPLRRRAEMVLANPIAPIEDIEPVLLAFKTRAGKRETEGDVAAWLIENAAWAEEQREAISNALSAYVERAVRSGKPAMYACRWFFRSMSVSILLTASFVYGRWWEAFLDPLYLRAFWLIVPAGLTMIFWFITVPLSIVRDNRMLKPMRRAVKLIGSTGGPGCLGNPCCCLPAPPRT